MVLSIIMMQNILGIIDTNGNLVVKYNYTVYGTITSILGSLAGTIGAYNPFRYKGYYYDTETSMYYCKGRYYVPEWCRWLNGDNVSFLEVENLDNLNLFSYCNNNPVMGYDPTGQWNWITFAKCLGTALIVAGCVALAAVTCGAGAAVMVGVSTVVSVAAQGVQDAIKGEFSGLDAYLGAAIGGAISGLGQGLGTTALTSGLGSIASGLMDGSITITSFNDACINFALGGVSGTIGYGISVGISRAACATKLSKIIGPSSKNKVINKNLEKAGYATIKMGKEGLSSVAKKFYEAAGFKTMERVLGQIYAFGTSFIL